MLRVLIAAKEETARQILGLTNWEGLGFGNVSVASGTGEAVSAILELRPQVVLVELEMHREKTLRLVDGLARLGLRPVFCALSSHRDSAELRRVMRCGYRDLLKTPVERAALEEFLNWVVSSVLHGEMPEVPEGDVLLDPVLKLPYSQFSTVTNKIMLSVHADYSHNLSLLTISRIYGMSSKYMGRVFLKETGLRFTEYLMAYRMTEAKRLILATGEKISVVAEMVGYSQMNNFYTHFRRYFGMSPGELRKNELIGGTK